ncbi:abortive infection bacteriophage resistance protein [Neobacillus niacini]|uniref:Abi family protein n=1 Tax=Neobacillus niacini TaxID=86668 RepID=UPI00277DA657|nr:Abi family protein [Neobacillus niacini]MDQ1005227.1 abortive infection bacteriophage resistance protein [Neobacillus niacini]
MDPEKDYSNVKPPKTYKEQVELYKNRNLYIENSEYAEKILQRINYYRLSAYGLTLKDPINKNQYISSSSFNKMLSLYEFDRRLRLLLLGVLETIEIAFRTHISYEIAHKFGPLGYKDKENFINEKFHKESLDELEILIKKSRKGELFIEHHYKKYEGIIPIWAVIEVTSFGFLSKIYRNLNEDVKKHIAKVYYNIPYYYLESWLQSLSNVRNVCAHYGRVYNKKLTFKPRLFREESKQFDNQLIFAAIYIIQRLLTKTEGNRFITDLEALVLEYEDEIEFTQIGFPSNWMELLSKINSKNKI